MKFLLPTKKGYLIKRYKRFFVDIQHKNQVFTAHIANTGSLRGVFQEGLECLVTETKDPKRKLKLSVQMIKGPHSWIGVNTALANTLVWEAWQAGKIPHWRKFRQAQREVSVSEKSRIDIVLSQIELHEKMKPTLFQTYENQKTYKKPYPFHFVEIKNVTLAHDLKKTALFPDAVTLRGQKHLKELMEKVKKGHTAEIVFLVQRSDCLVFSPAKDIDPEYARLLKKAYNMGVKISSYPCLLRQDGIFFQPKKLKVVL